MNINQKPMKMVMGEGGGVGNGRETSLTIPLKL